MTTAHAPIADTFRINALPPYHLGSIASAVNSARLLGRDVIDFSQINPDIPPHPGAVEKLVQAVLLPHNHRYSSSQGISKLREAISALYQRKYAVELDPEKEAVVTIGVKEGVTHLLLAICSPGDTVLLPAPAYPIHRAGIAIAGANSVSVPLFPSFEEAAANNYRLTKDSEHFFVALRRAYETTWPRPKVMLFSFPHNPTATTVTSDFYARLLDFADECGLLLINDFAYSEIAYEEGSAPSLLARPGAKERAVEFYSMSKGFSVPGWRVGFCVGNEYMVSALKKLKSYIDFGVFQPLQIAAVSALSKGEGYVEEVKEEYRHRRDILVDGLRGLGWGVVEPRAGVFVWAKTPESIRVGGSIPFSHQLLTEADVAVCPGAGFDPGADNYARFALGENAQRIRKGLERLAKFQRR